MSESRRRFLRLSCVAGSAGLVSAGCGAATGEEGKISGPSPSEYLMRQHGIVHRMALVFERVADRVEQGKDVPEAFLDTQELVQEFTEDYHEELEESYIFPRFAGGGPLQEMVSVLRMQHSMGHTLAQRAYRIARGGPELDESDRESLAGVCRSYSRMYRAHAAFEDTDMWPALRGAVSETKYADIRQTFTEEANEKLGEGGFSEVAARMAEVEKALGISGLSDFTPTELP